MTYHLYVSTTVQIDNNTIKNHDILSSYNCTLMTIYKTPDPDNAVKWTLVAGSRPDYFSTTTDYVIIENLQEQDQTVLTLKGGYIFQLDDDVLDVTYNIGDTLSTEYYRKITYDMCLNAVRKLPVFGADWTP